MADVVSTGTTVITPEGNIGVLYTFTYSILPQYAAWSAGTNYTQNTIVSRSTTSRLYKNLIAGTDAGLPEENTGGETPRWLDYGPIASPVYLTPDFQSYGFNGFGSMHLVQTAGQVTIQLQSDNSATDANFITGYDPDGVVHPALCTDLTFAGTPNKLFENIKIPPVKRHRWKFSNSSTTVVSTGTAYLYLSRGF